MTVSLDDIRAAAASIQDLVAATPCVRSHTLSQITGADVVLKLENLQFTGSFKDRGALVKLRSLDAAQRERGVIAMSAGNHAQAVAHFAQQLGISAVIVMPRYTPNTKVEHTRAFGAEVILHGDNLDEAAALAHRIEQDRGLYFVHPYDDEQVIAGQGTIALEMHAAFPDLEVLVIPVGGGGLIAGTAIAAKGLRPDIEIVGVETVRFPAMLAALQGRTPEFGTTTIAEGIAVKAPGRLTLPIIRSLVNEIVLVEETDIERAVLLLLEVEKTVAEGAGAAALAALLAHRERFAGRRVGVVISGGNIDLPVLSAIIERGLVHSGRLTRLRVDMRDVPGALAAVTACIAQSEANIVQVSHQRTFTTLPLQLVEVEFVVRTRGLAHVTTVLDALKHAGYAVRQLNAEP